MCKLPVDADNTVWGEGQVYEGKAAELHDVCCEEDDDELPPAAAAAAAMWGI